VKSAKKETLQKAYEMAKSNDGAPGIDRVTFEAIEESGVGSFLRRMQRGFSPRVGISTDSKGTRVLGTTVEPHSCTGPIQNAAA